jgi:hypothetical protein
MRVDSMRRSSRRSNPPRPILRALAAVVALWQGRHALAGYSILDIGPIPKSDLAA